jgi:hypothetical protein
MRGGSKVEISAVSDTWREVIDDLVSIGTSAAAIDRRRENVYTTLHSIGRASREAVQERRRDDDAA